MAPVKLLLIGDFHIPERAHEIPRKIKERLESGNYGLILCTGDLTRKPILEYLRSVARVKWVMGNMDLISGPMEEKVEIGGVRIGLNHGTEIYPRGDLRKLREKAGRMGVEVLVTGHTHKLSINLVEGKLILNPGSATGVWGGGGGSGKPSFIEMIVEKGRISVEGFELELDDSFSVRHVHFEISEGFVTETSP